MPPLWWIVRFLCNLALYVVPACSQRQDMAQGTGFWSQFHVLTPVEKLDRAFGHSVGAGMMQLWLEFAATFGTFLFSVLPAMVALIASFFGRKKIRFWSWFLCVAGAMVLGLAVRLIVEG